MCVCMCVFVCVCVCALAPTLLCAGHTTQANNVVVKESGECRQEEKLWNHVDLVQVRKRARIGHANLPINAALLMNDNHENDNQVAVRG